MEADAAIVGAMGDEVAFGGVVAYGCDCVVGAPEVGEGGDGGGASGVPEADGGVAGGGGELICGPVVIDGMEGVVVGIVFVCGKAVGVDGTIWILLFVIIFVVVSFIVGLFESFIIELRIGIAACFRFLLITILVLITATVPIVPTTNLGIPRKTAPSLDQPLLPTTIKHPLHTIPKHHPTHTPRMRPLQTLDHSPILQIPYPQRSIHATTHHGQQIGTAYGQSRDGIDVAGCEFSDEGGCEHAVEFGGGEGAGVFSGAGEGMGGGVEVAVGLAEVVEGGPLGGGAGAGEGFDFHFVVCFSFFVMSVLFLVCCYVHSIYNLLFLDKTIALLHGLLRCLSFVDDIIITYYYDAVFLIKKFDTTLERARDGSLS